MVSVIMPTYNKCKFLELTLEGFAQQSYQDFEIVIVDDGSIDQTKEVVDSYSDRLKIVYFYQSNKGRAKARNKALELSTGDFVVFCDDDRIPSKKFLEKHIAILESNEKIVTIGNKKEIISILRRTDAYSPAYIFDLYKKNPNILCEDYYKEDVQLFTAKQLREKFDIIINRYTRLEPADNFKNVYQHFNETLEGFEFGWVLGTTANLGVRRQAIKQVEFDEHFNGWGMEDTEFSYGLYMNGYRFVLAKDAINYHQYHDKDANHGFTLRKNMNYFYKKYNSLEAALFMLLMRTSISIVEVNEIYQAIKQNTDSILSKTYRNVLELAVLNESYINSDYLS